MRWPKYWSFSFSIILSKEIPGLMSFRMDLLDLLVVQGTLKSLLQHHSSKASSSPQICLFHSILIQPHSSCGLIYTLVLHVTLAHAMPIPALCLSLFFVYFWLCLIFIAVCRLSLVAASRGYSLVAVCGLLTVAASLVVEHGLISCHPWA